MDNMIFRFELQLELKILQEWKVMLGISKDHYLGTDTVHLVSLEINESLDWTAIHVILPCKSF